MTQQVFASSGQTPDEVARVIIEAATTDTPHFRYTTSDTNSRSVVKSERENVKPALEAR